MYHSKQNGGNSSAFYIPEMNAAAVERYWTTFADPLLNGLVDALRQVPFRAGSQFEKPPPHQTVGIVPNGERAVEALAI